MDLSIYTTTTVSKKKVGKLYMWLMEIESTSGLIFTLFNMLSQNKDVYVGEEEQLHIIASFMLNCSGKGSICASSQMYILGRV